MQSQNLTPEQQEKVGVCKTAVKGRGAIEALARRFPQLYVAPAEGTQDAHRLARTQGIAPEDANLEHFVGSEEDELREVETPAGPVEVLFLKNRKDFETFLQIVSHKSQPAPIARTVGAITYRGLADWGAVTRAHVEYLAQGGADWSAEFARLAAQPGTFRAELVVISEGPYSNIAAESTPFDEGEWLRVSREVRLHHECAHVVCRRTMPDDILPIWDEVTADVVGLLCATGRYDSALAALFLGVAPDGFADGRLVEYLNDEQKAHIDEISVDVHSALEQIESLSQEGVADPFDFLLSLKRAPIIDF